MIGPDKRKAVFLLYENGLPLREIGEKLQISRNTVKAIVEQEGKLPERVRQDKKHIDPDYLRELYHKCNGWKRRVYEILTEEEKIEIKYPTLTRLMRELGIGNVQKARCDKVPDEPGAEMQHDTTVYQVLLDGKRTKVIASCLYLRYSKRRYVKFYRTFNRFRMKCFLHEALMFWGYSAATCVIDNTSLARLRGTGKSAIIAPEMAAFGKQYGFEFQCHALGHPNRKAGNERSFYTVESNFLPGRTFKSLEDLNQQAFNWATKRMEYKETGKGKLIPAKAFEHERSYLRKLPPDLPGPYQVLQRIIDQYGFIAFDGNYFWVPGNSRCQVKVLQYGGKIDIYRGRKLLTGYCLPPDGVKNEFFSPEGYPKPRHKPNNRKRDSKQEESKLRAVSEGVSAYLDFVLKSKGIQKHRFMRKLFALKQKMSTPLFCKTVERSLKYRITDINTVKRISLLYINHSPENLPTADIDESFREREAYMEGELTGEPDLSSYDNVPEEDNG